MGKKSKNGEVILIKSFIDKKEKLTRDEKILKDDLLQIENKLNSVKKVLSSIGEDSIVSDETVINLIDSIAIAKIMEIIEYYFEN